MRWLYAIVVFVVCTVIIHKFFPGWDENGITLGGQMVAWSWFICLGAAGVVFAKTG